MNLDSGADHTVVRADLITKADYTVLVALAGSVITMGTGGMCLWPKCG